VIVEVLLPSAVIELDDATIVDWVSEALPGVTLNALEVAEARPLAIPTSVYPVPVLLIESALKVATPATAETAEPPVSVPLPALLPKANPTEVVDVVTRFPYTSCTSTVTAGLIVAAATTALGCVPNANCVAAPATPVAVKVTGEPLNVPLVAVSVFAPAVVPKVQAGLVAIPVLSVVTALLEANEPEPVATEKVTETPLTALPCASVTFTDGAVVTAVPTVALCKLPPFNAIVVAVPGPTLKALDVTDVRDPPLALSV
jgi:hypothetical protein